MNGDRDPPRSPRLHRSNSALAGFGRVAAGGGFGYRDVDGAPLTDPAALSRIEHWRSRPHGRTYGSARSAGAPAGDWRRRRRPPAIPLPRPWREQQARVKFDHMVAFARPFQPCGSGAQHYAGRYPLDRERVLSCSVRLLDVGLFRIGSEVYEKEDGHLGLATIAKANVSIGGGGCLRLRRQGRRPPRPCRRGPLLRRDRGRPEDDDGEAASTCLRFARGARGTRSTPHSSTTTLRA